MADVRSPCDAQGAILRRSRRPRRRGRGEGGSGNDPGFQFTDPTQPDSRSLRLLVFARRDAQAQTKAGDDMESFVIGRSEGSPSASLRHCAQHAFASSSISSWRSWRLCERYSVGCFRPPDSQRIGEREIGLSLAKTQRAQRRISVSQIAFLRDPRNPRASVRDSSCVIVGRGGCTVVVRVSRQFSHRDLGDHGGEAGENGEGARCLCALKGRHD